MSAPVTVRTYTPADYAQVANLYSNGSLYGGQFDLHRDAPERLLAQVSNFPEAVLVAFGDNALTGTLSLIDDGRIAWLYRFAVQQGPLEDETAVALYKRGVEVLAQRGHEEVLVYAPAVDERLRRRYLQLGMTQGTDYSCFFAATP